MEKTMETAAYKVLLEGGQGEIVEKKSRFIATVRSCETEEEAQAFLEEMKKRYWDAKHNCFAYVLGSRGEYTRYSDDREPAGTAGKPMLEVLLGEGIRNVAVVVTRYFGGTLLGTGGLVRAYTQAVQEGLRNCVVGVMRQGMELSVETDYNGVGKLLYLFGQEQMEPLECSYGECVKWKLIVPVDRVEKQEKEMTDVTNGKVTIHRGDTRYFVDK